MDTHTHTQTRYDLINTIRKIMIFLLFKIAFFVSVRKKMNWIVDPF